MVVGEIKNYLFGTGHYALPMKWYLESRGIHFQGVVVTHKNENYFDGTPVYEPREIVFEPGECRFFLAVSEKFHAEIEQTMKACGYNNLVKYIDEELDIHFQKANNIKEILIKQYERFLPLKTKEIKSWNRILIIRLDGIGDMVLSTPIFRELKRSHPQSNITLITSKLTYGMFKNCPYVDEIIPVDWQKMIIDSPFVIKQIENARNFMWKNFHGCSFDVTILPRYDCDYYGASFLALFSGSLSRVAFSENVNKEKAKINRYYDLIFSHTIMTKDVRHEVERGFQILETLGICSYDKSLELWSDSYDKNVVKKIFEKSKVSLDKKIIVFGLSANINARMWPEDKYVLLADKINSISDETFVFVLIGGERECDRGKYIKRNIKGENVLNLCGRVTLNQVYEILNKSLMYIGHDTGILHIASAAHTNVIEICATPLNAPLNHSSSTARFAPWQTECEIIRPKEGYWDDGWKNADGDFAIRDITVDRVFEAIKKFL